MAKYNYKAEIIRIVDGDTIRLRLYKDLDIGFYIKQTISTEMNFRLARIDTPEVRGIEKEAGLKVKAYVQEYLNDKELRAVTYKPDKYGRWLIDLYVLLDNGEEICFNDYLVETGNAVYYNGGKK